MTDRLQELRDLVAAVDVARQELSKAYRLCDSTLGLVLVRAEAERAELLEGGVQQPVHSPVKGLPAPCAHRRAHRPGRPAKIDTDAELRAFILARIDALTFPQLEAEVAKAFPPARRVRKSAIHAWWTKHRKALAAHASSRLDDGGAE
ncbi:hypothetical protein [Mameliella alba]|uniref:Uncharacterized protein n=1 Tax=Mameliella alba TaxID=561184 RepID=A0A0B3SRD4_9RHOB|nr:hypothetical protein [Mameliella alba]KHQ53004.1 hypothetical protein OA50_02549 [Mameliella alba]